MRGAVDLANNNRLEERLDVSFGGLFSTEFGYTNPTGEVMDGDLTRQTGKETIMQGLLVLTGGEDAVTFNPRTFLKASNTIKDSVIIETQFRPIETPEAYDTILSVGGNLYVRYKTKRTIEYGFDLNQNGQLASVTETIEVPEQILDYKLAIVYQPTETGAKMRTFINGVEYTTIESTNGRVVWGATAHEIGFGNDVHPDRSDRGLKGAFSRAVVTTFDGEFDPTLLKTMKLSRTTKELFALGQGQLEGTLYQPTDDEQIDGKLHIHGGAISDFGQIDLTGDGSYIAYTPTETTPDQTGNYFAELIIDPSALKPGTTLFDFAGSIILQGSKELKAVDLIIKEADPITIDLSELEIEDDALHLALIYHENELTLQSCQTELATITLDEKGHAPQGQVFYAGSPHASGVSLAGKVYGVGFTRYQGGFTNELLSLLGGPIIIRTDLEPGYQIPIKPNEYPASLAAKASLVRPRPNQVQWQQYEQTAFIHYGINTYYEVEWGDLWKHDDPKMFHPTDLNTDQWARSLKASGFKMAVLTVKHHDGFALYPSRYTDFSVASSDWRDGQGDVLREFVDSMRKYGLKVGIYLSPADHGAFREKIFANESERKMRKIPTLVEGDDREGNEDLPTFNLLGTDYGEMFMNQLYEVLTEYGKVDEVWFDGAQGHIPGDRAEKYDWDSIYTLINQLQPEAVIAITGSDVRWVGNESGWARENEWSVIAAETLPDGKQGYYPEFSAPDLGSRPVLAVAAANGMDYLTWWPAEVDVSIRQGWFYHDHQQPKSLDELREIYYQSVARNSVLLLNIPPNKAGRFAEADVKRLIEWHESIKRDFAVNYTVEATVVAENGKEGSDPHHVIDGIYETAWEADSSEPSHLTFSFDAPVEVERIILQENIHHGQQVESFTIDACDENGEWEEIYANESIGYKRIIVLPEPVKGTEFRLNILQSRGPVYLSEVGFYKRQ